MIGPSTDNIGGSAGLHIQQETTEDGRCHMWVPGTPIDLVGSNSHQVIEEVQRRINAFIADGNKNRSSWASDRK